MTSKVETLRKTGEIQEVPTSVGEQLHHFAMAIIDGPIFTPRIIKQITANDHT